ncbi:putative immunity protein [Enterococcus sp. DIV0876]|uniref:putative immunity protein n=1 Tax=Enterococcus sp. DIV0876 TaxID=2774633 RepID=UPI003D2FBBBA
MTVRKIKIADSFDLRMTLDDLYESTTQVVLAKWALELIEHIFDKLGYEVNDYDVVVNGISVNQAWQNGDARMHDVRQAGFKIHECARNSEDKLLSLALRVAGQAVGTGHMKEHAMVASDYAIKVINEKYPHNKESVIEERQWQIKALENQIRQN